MRRLVQALLTVVPCAGCASIATQAGATRLSVPFGDVAVHPTRRVFTSHLASEGGKGDGDGAGAGATARCWGTVRLVVNDDDTFEYLITIHNPVGESFTGAYLRRRSSDDHGEMVATLFSDVSLGERYLQLRGTVVVNRDRSAGVLAEEVRERPGDFLVTVASRANPRGAIVGTVE